MAKELKIDPVYELRLYNVAAGRIRDMEARVQNDLRTIFPKHGIRPLAGWTGVAGAAAPLYVYLTPFQNMQERNESWAGFYADPAWAECRARTNAGSELVERYDILFLRAIKAWEDPPTSAAHHAEPLVEMVIQSVAIGQTAAVRNEILEATVPTLSNAGAFVHGVFDIMSGRPLPCVVFFVSWPDLEKRAQAMQSLDLRTVETRAAGKIPLLDRADTYLMRNLPVTWA